MGEVPTGLYAHIPYCRQKCPYCDFNVWVEPASGGLWGQLEATMLRELEVRAACFAVYPLRSIYFGGGTPSLAPVAFFANLLDAIGRLFHVLNDVEITIEVDPQTANLDKFRDLQRLGINRINFGWQSTHDTILKVLGRGHNSAQSRRDFDLARLAGFENIGIDLIAAVPGQSLGALEEDLRAIEDLDPEHVSVYQLTYHANTIFDRERRAGRLVPVDEEREAQMLERIESSLLAAGFEHYEVSNYARQGYRSIHNSGYWQGQPYLGIGPGAHSFLPKGDDQGWRWENVRGANSYFGVWREESFWSTPPRTNDDSVGFVEELDRTQRLTERIICGVRTVEGIPKTWLSSIDSEVLDRGLKRAKGLRWLREEPDRWIPTDLGLRFADGLAELLSP